MNNNETNHRNKIIYYFSTIVLSIYSLLSIPIFIGIRKILELSKENQSEIEFNANNKAINYTILIGWMIFTIITIVKILLRNKVNNKKLFIVDVIMIMILSVLLQIFKTY